MNQRRQGNLDVSPSFSLSFSSRPSHLQGVRTKALQFLGLPFSCFFFSVTETLLILSGMNLLCLPLHSTVPTVWGLSETKKTALEALHRYSHHPKDQTFLRPLPLIGFFVRLARPQDVMMLIYSSSLSASTAHKRLQSLFPDSFLICVLSWVME